MIATLPSLSPHKIEKWPLCHCSLMDRTGSKMLSNFIAFTMQHATTALSNICHVISFFWCVPLVLRGRMGQELKTNLSIYKTRTFYRRLWRPQVKKITRYICAQYLISDFHAVYFEIRFSEFPPYLRPVVHPHIRKSKYPNKHSMMMISRMIDKMMMTSPCPPTSTHCNIHANFSPTNCGLHTFQNRLKLTLRIYT